MAASCRSILRLFSSFSRTPSTITSKNITFTKILYPKHLIKYRFDRRGFGTTSVARLRENTFDFKSTTNNTIGFACAICQSLELHPTSRRSVLREAVNGNVTVIEGVILPSDKDNVLHVDGPPEACSLCKLNLDLHHTDVLILRQFVNDDGRVLSNLVTGICDKQQKLIEALVLQAQKAGLMGHLTIYKNPKKKYFNRYFVPEKSGNKTKRYF